MTDPLDALAEAVADRDHAREIAVTLEQELAAMTEIADDHRRDAIANDREATRYRDLASIRGRIIDDLMSLINAAKQLDDE